MEYLLLSAEDFRAFIICLVGLIAEFHIGFKLLTNRKYSEMENPGPSIIQSPLMIETIMQCLSPVFPPFKK